MALAASATAWSAWLAACGPWAYGLAFFAVACASAPIQIPLEVGAGALFGLSRGVAVVAIAKNAGCMLAFAAARAAMRRAARRRGAATAGSAAPDAPAAQPLPACLRRWHAAFAAAPLRAACMVRLSPLPIAVKNLGLAAVPSVSGADFALSTVSCTLPYTLLHVLFGARAGTLADALASAERASGGALAASAVVAALVVRPFAPLLSVMIMR
jgi:uncharacterized membrane protein YdjX (TVP38/TMEM64 family)